jgi:hypothetical protein
MKRIIIALLAGILGLGALLPSYAGTDTDDTIPEVVIEGAATIKPGQTYTMTVQMDDDVRDVNDFTLDITFNPDMCVDNPLDTGLSPTDDPPDLTSRGFTFSNIATGFEFFDANRVESPPGTAALRVLGIDNSASFERDGPLVLFSISCTILPLEDGTQVNIGFNQTTIDFKNSAGGQVTVTGVGMTVEVPPNTPPTANSQSVTVTLDTPKAITLTGDDLDDDTITFQIVQNPTNGVLSNFNANTGTVTYTPNSGFTGADSFTFRTNDGQDNSNTATVSITVRERVVGGSTPSSTPSHTPSSSNLG